MKALLAVLVLTSSLAWAGNEAGGGGDVVVLPNGQVVLADPFLDTSAPQPDSMPKRVSLDPLLRAQTDAYTKLVVELTDDFIVQPNDAIKLFQELPKAKGEVVFYTVADAQELNTFCASGGRKAYQLPGTHKIEQVACTSGKNTFLIRSLFSRMSLQHQALLLFHERMTTLIDQFGDKNYVAIAKITSGLSTIASVVYEQQQGNFRVLTPNEVGAITGFYSGLVELEKRNEDITAEDFSGWRVHSNGGGLIMGESEIPESAFVSALSSIGPRVSLGERVQVLSSTLVFNRKESSGLIEVADDCKISKSSITMQSQIGARTTIKNSSLDNSFVQTGYSLGLPSKGSIVLGEDSLIENTRIIGAARLGARAKVQRSNLGSTHLTYSLDAGDEVQIEDSVLIFDFLMEANSFMKGEHLKLNSGSKLKAVKVTSESQALYAPEGMMVPKLEIRVVEPTQCKNVDESNVRRYKEQTYCVVNDRVLTSKNGILTSTPTVDIVRGYYVVRSWEKVWAFEPQTRPLKEPQHLIYDGKVVPAGVSRLVTFEPTRSNDVLTAELAKLGMVLGTNGQTSPYYLKNSVILPFR